MKTEQIVTMLKLQDRVNSAVNPDWRAAGNDWCLAIMIECAELIDHIGWKWWKKQEPNLPQAQIEVVDIWHFVLSKMMNSLPLARAEQQILSYLNAPQEGCPPVQAARQLSKAAAGEYITLSGFARLCQSVSLSHDDLFRMYVGKAALNLFRQQHGYKDGTYIKHWFGHEDNVFLEGLLTRGMTDLDEILTALEHQYAQVKAAALAGVSQ